MSFFKALFLAGILVFASGVGVKAKDLREELVDRILKPSEMQATSDIYMSQYAKEFVRSWKTTLQPMDVATEEVLLKEFAWRLATDDTVLLPKIRQLYLDLFTVEELKAMVEFYDSPVGESIASKTKLLDEEVAKLYYPGINDKAMKHWDDTVQALRASGNKL